LALACGVVSCADLLDIPRGARLAEAPIAPVLEAPPEEPDARCVELVANEDRPPPGAVSTARLAGCVPLSSPGVVRLEGESSTASDADAGSLMPQATPPGDEAGAPCSASQSIGPNGNCYAVLTTFLSWADARQSCRALGERWDLASIRSDQSNRFLAGLLTEEAWIGASDAEREGTWTWVDDGLSFWSGTGDAGSALSGAYVNWATPDPNGGSNSNCARIVPASTGWADLNCAELRGAVCEGPPG
jgi:hypothetical protein